MLVEVIKDIRAAEEKAENIKIQAQTEARILVRDAEVKKADIVQKTLVEVESEGRKILAAVEQESQSLIAPTKQRTTDEINQLISSARDKQEAAIKMVMERIVSTDGHS